MISESAVAVYPEDGGNRHLRKKCCLSKDTISSGRTSLSTLLSCNSVSFAVAFLCLAGVISNILSVDNGSRSPVYILADDLCKEADTGDGDKSQLFRMEGSFASGTLHIKQNLSFFTRFVIPDVPFQTFLLYSLPAGRSPPC